MSTEQNQKVTNQPVGIRIGGLQLGLSSAAVDVNFAVNYAEAEVQVIAAAAIVQIIGVVMVVVACLMVATMEDLEVTMGVVETDESNYLLIFH